MQNLKEYECPSHHCVHVGWKNIQSRHIAMCVVDLTCAFLRMCVQCAWASEWTHPEILGIFLQCNYVEHMPQRQASRNSYGCQENYDWILGTKLCYKSKPGWPIAISETDIADRGSETKRFSRENNVALNMDIFTELFWLVSCFK